MLYQAITKDDSEAIEEHQHDEKEILERLQTSKQLDTPLVDSETGEATCTSVGGQAEGSVIKNKYLLFAAMLACGEFGDKS